MKKLLIFSCIMGIALIGCTNNSPMSNDGDSDLVFPYPGSSPDPMTQETAVANTHLTAVNSSELDIPAGTQESYQCLWTSGTWAMTGTWNWTDLNFTFTVGTDGSLAIETINALCSPTGNTYATASAFYFPPNEPNALNYDLFGSVYWGYLPSLPTGWCWILMVDYSWTGLPNSHGISVQLDWAGAFAAGASTVPPISGVCGWPLVGNPPPPFTVNGI